MNGKLVGGALVGAGVIAGAGLYYLQVFHFYDRVDPATVTLRATTSAGDTVVLDARDVAAIDATSSPIRFRACATFDPVPDFTALTPYPDAEPLTAPFWFDCFDAAAIATALAEDRAQAFLGQADIAHGVDRVIVVFADGRGYAWHQLNPEFSE